jgi:hypothetical protein
MKRVHAIINYRLSDLLSVDFEIFMAKSGNIFSGREKIQKTFSTKSVLALPSETELSATTQNPQTPLKNKFSDVIAIAGRQGHLQPVSPENPAIINAKK